MRVENDMDTGEEKELEIKRMREMIAQKEQMRLRKLVSVHVGCTFVTLTGSQ